MGQFYRQTIEGSKIDGNFALFPCPLDGLISYLYLRTFVPSFVPSIRSFRSHLRNLVFMNTFVRIHTFYSYIYVYTHTLVPSKVHIRRYLRRYLRNFILRTKVYMYV